jgi:beta-lactamase class A
MKKILLETKVSLIWFVIGLIGIFIAGSSFVMYTAGGTKSTPTTSPAVQSSGECAVKMDQIREKNSTYVKPLLLTDVMVQDRSMIGLKDEIQGLLNQKIKGNQLQVASVYVRKMDNGAHISINENEVFNPASLMKLAYLITYLEEADYNPGRLQKKIYFDNHFEGGNSQNIVDFKLQEKSYYTIAQLLEAMIVYSDNDATMLLMQNLNNGVFTKLFSDLQLPPPPKQGEYFIGVEDFSKFFRVLYSSTYLSTSSSEYAISLLLKSTFRDGICSSLDPKIPVAHKFGERVLNSVAQLHEFGIVYYNNSPYLIGVMSKGRSLTPLKETLGEISSLVLRYMQANI